jgi:hypothetical protein
MATDKWLMSTDKWLMSTDKWLMSTDKWLMSTDKWLMSRDKAPMLLPMTTPIPGRQCMSGRETSHRDSFER